MYYRTVVNVNARRAALNNAMGRMWPAGRSLSTPGLVYEHYVLMVFMLTKTFIHTLINGVRVRPGLGP